MTPAATLSNSDATTAVLAAADRLFYSKGVEAVTMAELRDTSGVSLRRLYGLYPAKSDVVEAWLRDRHTSWTRDLTTGVDRRLAEGQEPLSAVFGFLEDWMAATDYRGCGFINTHAGSAGYTAEQRDLVRSHKTSLEEYLTDLIPHIPGLVVLVDGAIVQASIHGSPEPIRTALDLARHSQIHHRQIHHQATAAQGGTP